MTALTGAPASGRSRDLRVGYLLIERRGNVATLTMDRPEKLNAMTAAFWTDLRRALDLLAQDAETRVILITGRGRAFSAGGDIGDIARLNSIEQMRAYQVDAMAAFAHIERLPLMVIAAVNGLAFGGGCELALASDIVVAAESATFSLPEAALGLVPGFGVLRGPDVVGRHLVKLLIATGDAIDARRAHEIGLVQVLAKDGALLEQARAIAERIATRSPLALAAAKRMINRSIDPESFAYSVDEITALQASGDRAEGVAAFLERRAPVFRRRPNDTTAR